MIAQEHIRSIAERHLEGTVLYVTGIKISSGNHVNVYIDGDQGVSIANCVDLSRAIESELDRSKEDFALDVSSHGATTSLIMPRQYKKHLGRDFEIKLLDGTKAEGRMTECNDSEIHLEYTVRENKSLGKGKVNVVRQITVPYTEIKEAKVKLKY